MDRSPSSLTATSYLGQNTVRILQDLVAYLRSDADIAISCGELAGRSSPGAAESVRDTDLLWMCGSLTAVLLAKGGLAGRIVAAPVFTGHRAAVYHSVIIARHGGPISLAAATGSTLGINELESWSGHHGLRAHLATLDSPLTLDSFRSTTMTGSHHGSVVAVGQGQCDVAAIDVTVWDHLAKTEPNLCRGLRVIDRTVDWPAPPFTITARAAGRATEDEAAFEAALEAALLDLPPGRVAGLDGIVAADPETYSKMLVPHDI